MSGSVVMFMQVNLLFLTASGTDDPSPPNTVNEQQIVTPFDANPTKTVASIVIYRETKQYR